MESIREHSQGIKAEANHFLQETRLLNLLGQFGVVDLGGSYAYDLMVDRDLDFGIAISEINPTVRANIASTFASQLWAYNMNLADRVNFEPMSNLSAPRGLYLGLTIPFPKERWNIDAWFLIGDSVPQDEMAKLVNAATDEQRAIILQIKYDLMRSGQKQKGITSAEVYKAVLKHNIKTTEEFLKIR